MTQMPVSCSDEKRSEFVWFASVFGFTTFALSSSYFFFQDVIAADWPAWVIAPLLYICFAVAVLTTDPEGLPRGILYHAAVLLFPFMGLYSLLDELFRPDWPEQVILPLVLLSIWIGIGLMTPEDELQVDD